MCNKLQTCAIMQQWRVCFEITMIDRYDMYSTIGFLFGTDAAVCDKGGLGYMLYDRKKETENILCMEYALCTSIASMVIFFLCSIIIFVTHTDLS